MLIAGRAFLLAFLFPRHPHGLSLIQRQSPRIIAGITAGMD